MCIVIVGLYAGTSHSWNIPQICSSQCTYAWHAGDTQSWSPG